MTTPPNRVSQKIIREALAKIDWLTLESHLDEFNFTDDVGLKVLRYIERSERIVSPYPNAVHQKARTVFLQAFKAYAESHACTETAARTQIFLGLLDTAESGYTEILTRRAELAMATQTGEDRAMGVMRLAAQASMNMTKVVNEKLKTQKSLTSNAAHIEWNGEPANVDAINTGMTHAAGMTLMIEAYQADWFIEDGVIRLPQIPQFDAAKRDDWRARYPLRTQLAPMEAG